MTGADPRTETRAEPPARTVETRAPEETEALAAEIATTLQAGDVIWLSGDLGAGKTTFVRGLAAGLGLDPEEVSSPTFALVHEHRGGRLDLFHVDLYRLDRVAAGDLGLRELGVVRGVVVVEWPERLSGDLAPTLRVRINVVDDTTRRIALIRS